MNRPIIEIFLLPIGKGWGERKLRALHKDITEAVKSIPELGVKSENDYYTLFPADLMKKGLGEEIVVKSRIPSRQASDDVRRRFEAALEAAIRKHLPRAAFEFATDMPPAAQA